MELYTKLCNLFHKGYEVFIDGQKINLRKDLLTLVCYKIKYEECKLDRLNIILVSLNY